MKLPCGHDDSCTVTSDKLREGTSFCGYCAAEDNANYWRRKAEEWKFIANKRLEELRDKN